MAQSCRKNNYLNLQGNFQSINAQYNVNHVALTSTSGVPPNGFHTIVNMVPFSTVASNSPNNQPVAQPPTIAGFGTLYSAQVNDGLSTDNSLYFLTGNGINIPLTRNVAPLASQRGYTFLPGGFILQWGRVAMGGGSGGPNPFPVVFTDASGINFPKAIFNVQVSLGQALGSSANVTWAPFNLTTTGFSISNPQGFNSFFWIAIGN
jgi:hypothetical protein